MKTSFKKQLFLSAGVILGGIIVTTVVIYIISGNIDAATTKIIADRALVNEESGALSVVADLKQQAPQAVVYQTAMNQLLPTQDGLIAFNKWAQDLAASEQVTANFLFQGATTPPAGNTPGKAGFVFSATGSPDSLAAFLQDIEVKTPGFMVNIDSFDLTYQNGIYQLNGQGHLFFKQS